jgi:hypothetical protein
MNNHKQTVLDYEPLRKVVDALYEDDMPLVPQRESLKQKGYDPDRLASTIRKEVEDAVRAERLSWQDKARQNLQQMQVARDIVNWAKKSPAEIEEAFDRVLAGFCGADAQLKAQAAFRNYQHVSVSDKASLLDHLEALNSLGDHPKDSE